LEQKTKYRRVAPLIIGGLLLINTLLIITTGGIPSVLAHTMYIPVLLTAFYFGAFPALVVALLGGILVGPFMGVEMFNLEGEPIMNSLYRTLYFVGIGGFAGILFSFLQRWLNQVHIQNEELDATLMSIGDGVVITDEKGIIENINPTAADLLGLEPAAIIGRLFATMFQMRNHKTERKTPDPVSAVLENGQRFELERHTVLTNHRGETFHIEDSASPIRNSAGEIIGVVLVIRDVSEQRNREQRILHISYHDYLTGIPNRRFFQEQLDAIDHPDTLPMGLVMMDLNALKLINDAYGHELGNEALKHVGRALETVKREEEVIARIGGDEFAMIIPKAVETRIQSIKEALDGLIEKTPVGGITYSVAFGYAIKESATTDIRMILKAAEDNMYKNKVLFSKNTRYNAILSILNTLTDKFEEEKRHSERVAYFCKLLGRKMNLREDEVKELEFAGRLHDIGKITVPDAILKKPGRLTEDEWAFMTRHTVNGYQILRTTDQFSKLAEYAMSHHERMDGHGYPNQLSGEDIPLFARIICVVDAFEAMTSNRPYRAALSEMAAIAELKRHAGSQFDPDIVHLFVEEVYPEIDTASSA
jgi:diguanylate cyclase (GGDEF)-like protein/PAS domain S-box-containing protein